MGAAQEKGDRGAPRPAAVRASESRRVCRDCGCAVGHRGAQVRFVPDGDTLKGIEICAGCAGLPDDGQTSAPRGARRGRASLSCLACGESAPPTSPVVTRGDSVGVLCPVCSGDAPPAETGGDSDEASSPSRPRLRRPRAVAAVAVAAAVAALGFAVSGADNEEPPPRLLEEDVRSARVTDQSDTELRVPPRERPPIHDLSFGAQGDGAEPLAWYHPIAGERKLPENTSREFGAPRPGQRPAECGGGHCGVDLGFERGKVIHAVRPGLVDRIVRAPHRLSGKYVRLYHPEGFFTYYMHLDSIRPTLVPGVEIAAGEPLGLLGDTGIQNSPPHLHFAVSKLLEGGGSRYVDPEPMLERAVVLDEPASYRDEWRESGIAVARAEAHLGSDREPARRRATGGSGSEAEGADREEAAGEGAAADEASGEAAATGEHDARDDVAGDGDPGAGVGGGDQRDRGPGSVAEQENAEAGEGSGAPAAPAESGAQDGEAGARDSRGESS